MSDVAVDRRATRAEVWVHRDRLRQLAEAAGLTDARVGPDGVIIAHPPDSGYGATLRFAREASAVVGAWVQTIADDAPAADVPAQPL
jgi:pyrroloquinoline quinone (PQQ) biosynthesis protein C